MAYALEMASNVRQFLFGYGGLSREGRRNLFQAIDSTFRIHGDTFRNDPTYRQDLAPYLLVEVVIRDPHGESQVHLFRFVVDDKPAVHGVLRLVYVDTGGPPPLRLLLQNGE